MPDDCFWPGVRFARGSCNVTSFGAVGTVPQAVPFPSDIFGLTQISVLYVLTLSFSSRSPPAQVDHLFLVQRASTHSANLRLLEFRYPWRRATASLEQLLVALAARA